MNVVSIPKRPDASPEKKADAASAHSSPVTANPLSLPDVMLTRPFDAGKPSNREIAAVGERPLAMILGCNRSAVVSAPRPAQEALLLLGCETSCERSYAIARRLARLRARNLTNVVGRRTDLTRSSSIFSVDQAQMFRHQRVQAACSAAKGGSGPLLQERDRE